MPRPRLLLSYASSLSLPNSSFSTRTYTFSLANSQVCVLIDHSVASDQACGVDAQGNAQCGGVTVGGGGNGSVVPTSGW